MPPHYVKPFVKSNKNDYRDAEASAEAVQRPTVRFVARTTEAQLDLQTIHRVRQRLVGRCTSLINQLRAILLEHGVMVPQRRRVLATQLAAILADEQSGLSPRIHHLIEDMGANGANWTPGSRRLTPSWSPRPSKTMPVAGSVRIPASGR